jgi:glycosyltransferase involved in cell wall biosynthesis
MRIGVDLRPFLSRETGVGTYMRNLLFHLAGIDRDNDYRLLSSSWKERFPPEKIPPFARCRFKDLRIPVKILNLFWQKWGAPSFDAFFGESMDLTHSPTPLPLPTRGRTIVTVYDLFFLDDPEKADREARRVFFRKTAESLKKADGILVISEFTRTSILKRFDLDEGKILVAPPGLDPVFRKDVPAGAVEEVRRRFDLPERFLLFVGALEARKNLVPFIDALAEIHRKGEKITLVCAGREGEDAAAVKAAAGKLGLDPWIRFPGYLPASDVRALFRLATAFVFPSLCEGFGLPLLEAMASGLPAAVSRTGALPEVGGDAAVYFDPTDTGAMAGVVLDLLGNEGKRREMAEKGKRRAVLFDWDRTARLTLEFYGKTAGLR